MAQILSRWAQMNTIGCSIRENLKKSAPSAGNVVYPAGTVVYFFGNCIMYSSTT